MALTDMGDHTMVWRPRCLIAEEDSNNNYKENSMLQAARPALA